MRQREATKQLNDQRAQFTREAAAELHDSAKSARSCLEALTDMCPGLNRNPHVQNLRVHIEHMRSMAAALK